MRSFPTGARHTDPRTAVPQFRGAPQYADTSARIPRPSRARTAVPGCSIRAAWDPCLSAARVVDVDLARLGIDPSVQHDLVGGRLTPQLRVDAKGHLRLLRPLTFRV